MENSQGDTTAHFAQIHTDMQALHAKINAIDELLIGTLKEPGLLEQIRAERAKTKWIIGLVSASLSLLGAKGLGVIGTLLGAVTGGKP